MWCEVSVEEEEEDRPTNSNAIVSGDVLRAIGLARVKVCFVRKPEARYVEDAATPSNFHMGTLRLTLPGGELTRKS